MDLSSHFSGLHRTLAGELTGPEAIRRLAGELRPLLQRAPEPSERKETCSRTAKPPRV